MQVHIDRTDPCHEGATKRLRFTLEDEDGQALPSSSVLTLTCTLYNRANGTVINSRSGQNVKDTNGGTLHATSGLFTFKTDTLDSAIQDDTKPGEVHVFIFRWTYGSSPVAHGVYAWALDIPNEVKVP